MASAPRHADRSRRRMSLGPRSSDGICRPSPTLRESNMITRRKTLVVLSALALGATSANAAMSEKDKKKAKADIDKMEGQILAKLYKLQPGAKKTVESAAGYATFSNFGMKIFFAGSGKGAGVAVAKGKSRTYMKFFEVQAGLGFGVKKFSLVWVFDKSSALDKLAN